MSLREDLKLSEYEPVLNNLSFWIKGTLNRRFKLCYIYVQKIYSTIQKTHTKHLYVKDSKI